MWNKEGKKQVDREQDGLREGEREERKAEGGEEEMKGNSERPRCAETK